MIPQSDLFLIYLHCHPLQNLKKKISASDNFEQLTKFRRKLSGKISSTFIYKQIDINNYE